MPGAGAYPHPLVEPQSPHRGDTLLKRARLFPCIMSEATAHKEIMDTLMGIKNDVKHLQKEVHEIMEQLEDSKLSKDERVGLSRSIIRVQKGIASDFIAWDKAKKELEK